MSPDEITTLAVQLGRLEQKVDDRDNKLDAIHRSLKDDFAALTGKVDQVDTKVTETNGRVRKAELNDAKLKGMFLVFAGASPFLVTIVGVVIARVIS